MNHRILLGIAIACCGVLYACSPTHYVHIRHPLHVGMVDPNEVPFGSRLEENARGLPAGVLNDTASLTEVTPDRICLVTNLWSIDELDPARGDYNNYRIALLNDQDGVEQTNGQVQLDAPVINQYEGHISERIPTGTRRVCARWQNRSCVRYRDETVYQTVYTPHVWAVTSHPANVCFANQGFVTPSTTRVALEMDAVGPASMTFEWQFDSAVAGGDVDNGGDGGTYQGTSGGEAPPPDDGATYDDGTGGDGYDDGSGDPGASGDDGTVTQ